MIVKICINCEKNNLLDGAIFYLKPKIKELRGNDICTNCYPVLKQQYDKTQDNTEETLSKTKHCKVCNIELKGENDIYCSKEHKNIDDKFRLCIRNSKFSNTKTIKTLSMYNKIFKAIDK